LLAELSLTGGILRDHGTSILTSTYIPGAFDPIYIHTHTHTHTHIYIYIERETEIGKVVPVL